MFNEYLNKFRSADIVRKYIFANVTIHIFLVLIGVFSVLMNEPGIADDIRRWFELPASTSQLLQRPWTLFTYMFLHQGVLMHILWNMFALLVFGGIFLNFYSVRHFIGTYLLGGLFGAVFYVVAFNVFPYFSNVVDVSYLVGASASVLAIVTATAVRCPDFRLNMLFFGSVKLSTFALVAVFVSVLMLSGENAGGNFAHLGGAFGGLLVAVSLSRGTDITELVNRPIDWVGALFKKRPKKAKKGKFTYSKGGKRGDDYEYNARKKSDEAEIDKILEKIKKGGYASLTDDEKRRLFDASSRR